MKCAASASVKSSERGGLSYSEERNQILFFGIDWDLKPEINIHTLHRTEHLVAIYLKGRVIFFPPGSGACGEEVEVSVCGFLVMKTILLREKCEKLLVVMLGGDICSMCLTWPSPQRYTLTTVRFGLVLF